ncbi:hypothetical protein ACIBSV_07535 [Embleya sp. NPDC050154]|uniref:hypothetical protein n=1 Tax=unclassified Embleya TaxID=2699296 RepID=UPI0037959333
MDEGPRKAVPTFLATPVLAAIAAAAWAAWLGWDQHRDVHPDGSTTGPYQAWQVVGLVLTLFAAVCRAASRGHVAAATIGTTTGLTLAAYLDWSDDSSGLYMVGVTMVGLASVGATGILSHLVASARHQAGSRRPRH